MNKFNVFNQFQINSQLSLSSYIRREREHYNFSQGGSLFNAFNRSATVVSTKDFLCQQEIITLRYDTTNHNGDY